MSEIDFFMTEEDTIEFCQFISTLSSCTFISDGAETAQLSRTSDPARAANALDPDGFPARLFITSCLWTMRPLLVDEIHHNDGRHRWYVAHRYAGPAFDFKRSRVHCAGNDIEIFPGWFSDYPWYYFRKNDPATFDRPETMSRMFKDIKNYIRRNGARAYSLTSSKPGPWMLKHAAAALDSGALLRQGDTRFGYKPL